MVEGMDPVRETVRIHGKDLRLKAVDYSWIMGLKDDGNEVPFKGDSRFELIQHMQSQLVSDNGEINLNSLKKIVLQWPKADLTFMISYVLFAMATLTTYSFTTYWITMRLQRKIGQSSA
ncbi:hypothetical protein M0R45_006853 [Rubus argutus]|uniref:Uncharacterized protein n=1 Tax=Rubus argutus TaxID=59490 RepID=A0AAW1YRP3_RUBAR